MQKKPFIHLLRSPNSGYFFDVNRNEIVPVDDEVFEYLLSQQENIDLPEISLTARNHIDNLKNEGYLSPHKVQKIEHPEIVNLHEALDNGLGMICLQVTQKCNLRCEYCIYSETNNKKQRTHSNKNMSFEVAKQAVKFLFDHSKDSETINIGFYGGEPLIALSLIKQIVEYSEILFEGRDILFNMTTNATLLTPDVVDYLFLHNVTITISLDGPKEIHDKHRRFKDVGSFDRLLNNVNYIATKYPEKINEMFISMVIDRENDFDDINSVFEKYPIFRQMKLQVSTIDETYSEEKIKVSEKHIIKSEYNTFIGLLHMFGRLEKKYVSPIVLKSVSELFDEKLKMDSYCSLPNIACPGGPCVAGNRRLFCDVNGNLFPCERVSESSSINKIGVLNDGFDFDAIKRIMNVAAVTKDQCINCWAFAHCTQCIRGANGDDHIDKDIRLSNCNATKAEVDYFLRNAIMINEIEYMYNK